MPNVAKVKDMIENDAHTINGVYTFATQPVLSGVDIEFPDDQDVQLGTDSDGLLRWSTADASNHAIALGLGDSNQALHVTDKAAIATDWNVSADTHPTVYVHSNTTPATDYITIGAHDGTIGHINVVGGTTLSLDIGGTARMTLLATGVTFTAVPASVDSDDTTDGVVDTLVMSHSSSDNNATAGDGVGISFELENATGTSLVEEWASIDVVSTTITNGSEDGDLVVKAMLAGTVTEALRLDSSDQSLTVGRNATDANGVNKVRIYPLTTAKGSLVVAAVDNTGDTVTTISNAAMGQASVISIPDPGAATGTFALEESANIFTAAQEIRLGSAGTPGALLLGGGTDAAPNTTAVAGKHFIEFRGESTATTGSARVAYLRLYLNGANSGGGGDCFRAFTTIEDNVGTARGAHISLNFEAAAGGSETSGLGTALTGTLHIPDVASWAPTGTYAAADFEIYSDGVASDPAGMTELSVLRLGNSGDATGKADVDTDAFIITIQGFTSASGTTNAISSTSLTELPAGNVGIRVKVGSGTYYIPAVAAADWN